MLTLVTYLGDSDQDGLPNDKDMDPMSAYPVLATPSTGSSDLLGGSGTIIVQWPAGSGDVYAGTGEFLPPLSLGAMGLVHLVPAFSLPTVVAGPPTRRSSPTSSRRTPCSRGCRSGSRPSPRPDSPWAIASRPTNS
jgi:hypothetical protein